MDKTLKAHIQNDDVPGAQSDGTVAARVVLVCLMDKAALKWMVFVRIHGTRACRLVS